MRTIVDIPEKQLAALDRMRDEAKVSRAELVRRAIEAYVRSERRRGLEELPGFGCWGKRAPDGLALQKKLRAEWRK